MKSEAVSHAPCASRQKPLAKLAAFSQKMSSSLPKSLNHHACSSLPPGAPCITSTDCADCADGADCADREDRSDSSDRTDRADGTACADCADRTDRADGADCADCADCSDCTGTGGMLKCVADNVAACFAGC